jgi:two-component system chemotaxis response regulator CheB
MQSAQEMREKQAAPDSAPRRDTVVVGASMGGLAALRTVLAGLPADFAGAIFIVQHVAPDASPQLASLLQTVCRLPVRTVEAPEPIGRGQVYVAPPDRHLIVWGEQVLVTGEPRENRARPSINQLFRAAAASRSSRTVGVLLTGRLDDGIAGLTAIKRCSGVTIVQDPADAEYPDLPRRALADMSVDYVLPAAALGGLLATLAAEPAPAANVPNDVLIEAEMSLPRGSTALDVAAVGKPTLISCPSCGGPLWKVGEEPAERYRCSVGHALSTHSLLLEQAEEIERVLWTAVRTLDERAAVLGTISAAAETHGRTATRERSAAAEAHGQSLRLRRFLVGLRAHAEQAAVAHLSEKDAERQSCPFARSDGGSNGEGAACFAARCAPKRSSNRSTVTGFVRCRLNPAAAVRSRSLSWPHPVTATSLQFIISGC